MPKCIELKKVPDKFFVGNSQNYAGSLTICHMGSHNVTCHRTQAITPRFNPKPRPVRLVLDLSTRRDGRHGLTYVTWLRPAAGSQTRDRLLKSPTPLPAAPPHPYKPCTESRISRRLSWSFVYFCISPSDVKSSRPKWPRGQNFGIGLKDLASALASASNIWPRPGLDLVGLLCNRAFFGQKSCKIRVFC